MMSTLPCLWTLTKVGISRSRLVVSALRTEETYASLFPEEER